MINDFLSLLGEVENTYSGMIIYMGCMIMLIFIATSFLQFLASLFVKQ